MELVNLIVSSNQTEIMTDVEQTGSL